MVPKVQLDALGNVHRQSAAASIAALTAQIAKLQASISNDMVAKAKYEEAGSGQRRSRCVCSRG